MIIYFIYLLWILIKEVVAVPNVKYTSKVYDRIFTTFILQDT